MSRAPCLKWLLSVFVAVNCGVTAARADAIDLADVLENIRLEHKQPALAAAVVNSEKLLARGATGKRRAKQDAAVQIEDRFHIGSCTKSITATAIAKLVHDGKLKWDTTVVDVFPELGETMHESYRSVTLKQLLTHTAGVPAFTSGAAAETALTRNLQGTPTEQRRQFLQRVVAQPPAHAPGTKMMYSNGGYGLAAAMAEKASGQTWEELLRQHVFKPLDMQSASFGWPANKDNTQQPCGHYANGRPHWPNEDYTLPPAIAPAGDVHCTITDFAKYAQFHLRGLRREKCDLLNADEFQTLHSAVKGNYAMGWVRRGQKDGTIASWHNGSAGTFFSWIMIWPQRDLAIVVCTNSGGGEPACKAATDALFERFAKDVETADERR